MVAFAGIYPFTYQHIRLLRLQYRGVLLFDNVLSCPLSSYVHYHCDRYDDSFY